MIETLRIAGRERARLEQLLRVATKFGLGSLFGHIGSEPSLRTDKESGTLSLAHRTRLALEELGPTFVKLGQILATRGDLLSPEWTAELENLHSNAPTLPFEGLRAFVEDSLGQPPETAFASFDPVPIAAASMAQVHRAVLHSGEEVVLKIRRPGIRPQVEADLRLMAHLAAMIERSSSEAKRFAPAAMMRQLAAAMLEELDFSNEGRNADLLRDDFSGNSRVIVPKIHWEWSSETLLVMDFISGLKPRNAEELSSHGINPEAIAALGSDMVLDMVLINGRFHGDPHPGNLLCLPGDRIALLDLGMIGHVSPRRREEFVSFVQALVTSEPAQLTDVLVRWSNGTDLSIERITSASERLIARHGSGRLVLSALVTDFLKLMRDERISLPADLLLIFKALITIDGVFSAICPGFDLTDSMRRSSLRLARSRLSPEHWMPTVQAVIWELAKVGDDAPRLIRALIRHLESNPNAVASILPTKSSPDARLVAASVLGSACIIALTLWVKMT